MASVPSEKAPSKVRRRKPSALIHDPFDEFDDFAGWIEELNGASDRAAALVATARLDRDLEDAIHSRMVGLTPSEKAEIFRGPNAPLLNFGTKIRIGYAFGLCGPITRDALNVIANVRNIFAHSARPLTFERPEIADLCMGLTTALDAYKKLQVYEALKVSKTGLLEQILPSTKPRHVFLHTVSQITLYIMANDRNLREQAGGLVPHAAPGLIPWPMVRPP